MAIINVTTFSGVDPTGNTDSTQGIKAAMVAAAGQTLFFPKGTYLINESGFTSIDLSDCIMAGESTVGDNHTWIKAGANVGSKYLFQFPDNASSPRLEIHNINFQSGNILDLRLSNDSGSRDSSATVNIYNCDFESATSIVGIAINMLNHDFSIISNCNFYNFAGLCAVRVMGWLVESGEYADKKPLQKYQLKTVPLAHFR